MLCDRRAGQEPGLAPRRRVGPPRRGPGTGWEIPSSEERTWLNPTEMRQSLAPIQSSRESLLFSCPGTLCKAQETRPSAFPPPAPCGFTCGYSTAVTSPGAERWLQVPTERCPRCQRGGGSPQAVTIPSPQPARWPPRCWCGGWDERGVAAGNVSVMARIPAPPAPPGLPLWQAWGFGGARAPRSCSMLAGTRRCLTPAMAREGEALTSPDASPGSRSVPNPGCRRQVPHGCPDATETPMAN